MTESQEPGEHIPGEPKPAAPEEPAQAPADQPAGATKSAAAAPAGSAGILPPGGKSRWRMALDFLVLLLCFAGLGAAGWYYWFGLSEPAPEEEVILEPDRGGVNLEAMFKMIRSVPAGPDNTAWDPPALANRWKYITVHHSGSLSGNAAIFDADHRKRGMTHGLGYHFVITNGHGGEDGAVEIGPRWSKQLGGGHLKGDELNHVSIGICLVGDFTKTAPTPRQIASLKALLRHLMKISLIQPGDVRPHKGMPGQATECPGLLPVDLLMQNL